MSGEENSAVSRGNPSPIEVALAFFKIGLTAYGMAILQQIRATILGNKWLKPEDIDEGLAMVQFYPGPIIYDLSTYCAYRISGFVGAGLAMFAFIFPSYLLMLLLSFVYFRFGQIGWVHPIFVALEAMVVGIVIHIFFDFSARHLKNWRGAVLAGTAFILLMFKVSAIAIILVAMVAAEILMKDLPYKKAHDFHHKKASRIDAVGFILTGAVFVGILIWGILAPKNTMGQLLFSMFKVGAVAFGNAFTIMPLLHQEAVVSHSWLTMKQFADGIALGQITPGPFLITATFIGFKVDGIWGSALATFGIFFPSFFYTLLATETYHRIRRSLWVRRAVVGVLAAFTGMLGYIALTLGIAVLKGPLPWIWTISSLIGVRYFKLNLILIFLIGITVAVLFYFLGIVI